MRLPASLPKDVYGLTDVCVTPGVTAPRAVWVKVVNASALVSVSTVVSGLSANFPYTVTVQALLNGNLVSAASAPIEGLYFWARRMPPRQQRLVMWLDAKWMPAGAVGTWPDASGNGHHAINTAATAQRPVTVHTKTGYGYDFITPGAVTFTRASAQYLVSDADGVHLGGAGPMTVYWFARNRYTSSQLLVGRGAIANRLDTASSGWAAAISSTSFDTSGLLSFRHGAPAAGAGNTGAALPVAASQVRLDAPIYNGAPSLSSHIGVLTPVMLANGSSAGPNADALALARAAQLPGDYNATAMPHLGAMGLYRAVACNAPNCSTGSEAVFFDGLRPLFNNTYSSYPYAVTYSALGTNVNLQPTPAVGTDLNLRIGGQPYTTNTATAYQGDLLGLLIYNEVHDPATRSAVTTYYAVSRKRSQRRRQLPLVRMGGARASPATRVPSVCGAAPLPSSARSLRRGSAPPGPAACLTACVQRGDEHAAAFPCGPRFYFALPRSCRLGLPLCRICTNPPSARSTSSRLACLLPITPTTAVELALPCELTSRDVGAGNLSGDGCAGVRCLSVLRATAACAAAPAFGLPRSRTLTARL
jgi:hypothetical protein